MFVPAFFQDVSEPVLSAATSLFFLTPSSVKALLARLGLRKSRAPEARSDARYRALLRRFRRAVAFGFEASELYRRLTLGTPKQLYKLGLVLSRGYYAPNYKLRSRYQKFPIPRGPNGEIYAPIEHFRAGCESTFVINLDAFDEENPVFVYARDGRTCMPVLPQNLRALDEITFYRGEMLTWMEIEREGRTLLVDRDLPLGDADFPKRKDEMSQAHAELCENLRGENVAVFFDGPEKEFDLEICLREPNGTCVPIFRYQG